MKKLLLIISMFVITGCSNAEEKNQVPIKTEQNTQEEKNFLKEKKPVGLVNVSAEKFKELIENKSSQEIILDIRTPQEFAEGYIENAELLDYYSRTFQTNLASLDKNAVYYMYCRSGSRSGSALQMMKSLGFTSVYNLESGIIDWQRKKFPLVK